MVSTGKVIIVVILKNNPGSMTIFPVVVCIDSRPIATPYPCKAEIITVKYLEY